MSNPEGECEFNRFDDLVSDNGTRFWDVRLPLKERMEQIQSIRDELKKEYEAALKAGDFGDIDTGVLWGAFSLVDSLVLGRSSTTTCRLQDLKRGHPLWDIRLPKADRLKRICQVQEEVTKEWQAHCDDDDASWIDTGALLGAVNLIDDLLKGVVETMTQSKFRELGYDAIPGYGTAAQWKYSEAKDKLAAGTLRIVPDEEE